MAKKKKKVFNPLFILVLIILGGILFGLYLSHPTKQSNHGPVDYTSQPTPTSIVDNTIKFDVEKAKVGDTIGNMTIIRLNGGKQEKPTAYAANVEFSGQVKLTGNISYTKPNTFMGETVCMQDLNTDSLARIPKIISDTRVIWFCFTNIDEAKKALVINGQGIKNATVVIDNYSIAYLPIDVYNKTTFISLEK